MRSDHDLVFNSPFSTSVNPKRPSPQQPHPVLAWLKDNALFFILTSLTVLAKFILFLGIVNNDNTSRFNITKALFSFSSLPPLPVYLAMIFIPLSFSFLFKGRARFWYLIIANLLITSLVVTDLMYYRGFTSFISPYVFSETTNLNNLSDSVISMLRPIDIFFAVDLLVFIGVHFLRKTSFNLAVARNKAAFALILLLSFSCIYLEHVRLDLHGNGKTMLFRVSWSPNQTMTNLSPLGYHVYDVYNYYQNKKVQKITPQDTKEITAWFQEKQENLPPNRYSGMFSNQNLIVIQVESLENSVINQKINGQEITPNLNKLLANSFYFSNFYEQVYNGTSSDADLMTNTSVYPIRTGSTFFRFPDNTYNSLPKLLEKKGYHTTAIHPDKGSYWNWQPSLKSIGFQTTIDSTHFNQDEQIGLGISDGSYLKQVAPIVSQGKQPFYDFIVTLTSHNPFDLPQQYRTLTLDQNLDESKLGGYFQSIHYTDQQLGTFLNTLDRQGVLNNSVVVIYGDHTGVHKYYDDEVKKLQPQESWWLDDSKRIPLIIYHKGMRGEEVKVTGGQIDTMPTIAALMGIDGASYKNTAFGRNLLDTKKNFAVLANQQFIGQAAGEKEKDHDISGLDLSNLIVSKNYFKAQGY